MSKASFLSALCVCVSAGFAAEPTADQILGEMDNTLYAAKDKESTLRFTLTEKSGKESVRDMITYEKGSDKRVMKFTSPADQKGISFLSMPNDVMYLYLPAFAKTRRIASSVKNTKFAGTDFTYEDLEAKRYALKWAPQLLGQDSETWQLKLTPKPGTTSDYSSLKIKLRKDNHYPVMVEYFDKSGAACKTMTRSKLESIDNVWEARETLVENLKNGHKTRLEIVAIKHNNNVSEDTFTERFLTR